MYQRYCDPLDVQQETKAILHLIILISQEKILDLKGHP